MVSFVQPWYYFPSCGEVNVSLRIIEPCLTILVQRGFMYAPASLQRRQFTRYDQQYGLFAKRKNNIFCDLIVCFDHACWRNSLAGGRAGVYFYSH